MICESQIAAEKTNQTPTKMKIGTIELGGKIYDVEAQKGDRDCGIVDAQIDPTHWDGDWTQIVDADLNTYEVPLVQRHQTREWEIA